jgi:HSP20 family protein
MEVYMKSILITIMLLLSVNSANAGFFDWFGSDDKKEDKKQSVPVDVVKSEKKEAKQTKKSSDDKIVISAFDIPVYVNKWMNMMVDDIYTHVEEIDKEMEKTTVSISFGVPKIDAFVENGRFNIVADLPGIEKENIDIIVKDRFLTIRGKQEKTRKNKTDGYYLNERSLGKFSRTIALPVGSDPDSAESEFKNGVLKITMPIKEPSQENIKKIKIN